MSIIHNALSGALAAQAALHASSQNVANAMTPGYSRQGVLLASVQLTRGAPNGAGSGVAVASLLRFSESYKSQQLWTAESALGLRQVAQPYLTQLEQVMGDDQAGIDGGLDAFFAALNAASVEPTSTPLRQQVLTSADALAQRFNSVGQLLADQRTSVLQQRTTTVAHVNSLAQSIAALNGEIAVALGSGANAAGLLDARDVKIGELAALAAVQVVDQPDGTRSVSLPAGQPLVIGARAATMRTVAQPDGSQTLTVRFANETFLLPDGRLGGRLGGLEAFEYGTLLPIMTALDETARELSSAVNATLAAGFAPDGTPGQPLFEYGTAAVMGRLSVRQGATPAELAFSSDAGLPGNSDNLHVLIGLRRLPIAVAGLGNVAVSDVVTQLVGRLGVGSRENQVALDTANAVRDQAEESWKSVSGVNNDEEAVALTRYLQMYQSNMKVAAVAGELFDATLAMLR